MNVKPSAVVLLKIHILSVYTCTMVCAYGGMHNNLIQLNTEKFLNFQTPTNFTVNTLKFKLKGSTIVYYL